jgi:hypothetical protein
MLCDGSVYGNVKCQQYVIYIHYVVWWQCVWQCEVSTVCNLHTLCCVMAVCMAMWSVNHFVFGWLNIIFDSTTSWWQRRHNSFLSSDAFTFISTGEQKSVYRIRLYHKLMTEEAQLLPLVRCLHIHFDRRTKECISYSTLPQVVDRGGTTPSSTSQGVCRVLLPLVRCLHIHFDRRTKECISYSTPLPQDPLSRQDSFDNQPRDRCEWRRKSLPSGFESENEVCKKKKSIRLKYMCQMPKWIWEWEEWSM